MPGSYNIYPVGFYLCIYPQQVSSISCWGFLCLKINELFSPIFSVWQILHIFMSIHNTKQNGNMKQCVKCREVKDESNFSKCSARKDGLQWNCKSCNKEDNLKFRKEINPEHHAEWQRKNPKRLCELVSKYTKADKSGIIYLVKNPAGEYYIGQSKKYMTVRKTSHTTHYNRAKKGKMERLPLLHDSFDKYGIKNHIFKTIVDLGDIDREHLKFIETSFIIAFKEKVNTLNVRIKS